MSELATAMRIMKSMPTAIQRYPSGKYGLVGSIPIELTEKKSGIYGQPYRASKIWNTQDEVIADLLRIGVNRFQLADCSWYQTV